MRGWWIIALICWSQPGDQIASWTRQKRFSQLHDSMQRLISKFMMLNAVTREHCLFFSFINKEQRRHLYPRCCDVFREVEQHQSRACMQSMYASVIKKKGQVKRTQKAAGSLNQQPNTQNDDTIFKVQTRDCVRAYSAAPDDGQTFMYIYGQMKRPVVPASRPRATQKY